MRLVLSQKGVFYCENRANANIDVLIETLLDYCQLQSMQMARVCFHRDKHSELMAMLIVLIRKYCYPPHRHRAKSESYIVCKGQCNYTTYNENGSVSSKVRMLAGDYIYNDGIQYHSLEPLTDMLAFIEHTRGPFKAGQNEFLDVTN